MERRGLKRDLAAEDVAEAETEDGKRPEALVTLPVVHLLSPEVMLEHLFPWLVWLHVLVVDDLNTIANTINRCLCGFPSQYS